MKEENDIPLCSHMSLAKAHLQIAYQLWPAGKLRAMADELANAQAELREAESRINKIIFDDGRIS
jgi:hypothetical protein